METQRGEEERAVRANGADAPWRAVDALVRGIAEQETAPAKEREEVRTMGVPILCPVCGKKLGERVKSCVVIRHKGREVSFVPAQKSTVKLRCDNKKCRTLYCFSMEGLDKGTQ